MVHKYFAVSRYEVKHPVCWEECFLAEDEDDALAAFFVDTTIGDFVDELSSEEAYDAVPDTCFGQDYLLFEEIPGFEWKYGDGWQALYYKGKEEFLYRAIHIPYLDEEEEDQDDREVDEETCIDTGHWCFDETCNWKIGYNDGWD